LRTTAVRERASARALRRPSVFNGKALFAAIDIGVSSITQRLAG
jgi:hypothetical protein